jgi:hypothetical protein
MARERVVGWVSEGSAQHPVGRHTVTHLGSGALAFAVRSPLGPFELLLVLPPGLEASRAGRRVETATVLRPGQSLRAGNAAAGLDLEFTLAAEFGTACECRVDQCDVCGVSFTEKDGVVRCPDCGVVACVELCGSAHQCTRCGALLEERWT